MGPIAAAAADATIHWHPAKAMAIAAIISTQQCALLLACCAAVLCCVCISAARSMIRCAMRARPDKSAGAAAAGHRAARPRPAPAGWRTPFTSSRQGVNPLCCGLVVP
jgi:hypothetical protein